MKSSTLCNDVNQEHHKCFNLSHSNVTKATSAAEKLERKNKGENQQMTPRSWSNGFPSPRGEIDW
jgi:hypothetical protein